MNRLLPSGVIFSDAEKHDLCHFCVYLPPFMKSRSKFWHLSKCHLITKFRFSFVLGILNFKCNGRDIQILRGTSWRYRDASLQLFLNVALNPSQFHFQGKCETEDLMTGLTTECHFLSHSSFIFLLNVLLQCLRHAKLSWISLSRTESTTSALFATHFPTHDWW